jgi:phosphopantothenoylcysteine decarboxylase / phosphopantothenate---cysteine ligase
MKIALGVSGGIAAYKAAEIVRLLQDRNVRVQVIMTRAAQEFVRPLTFAALSGEKVITEMFREGSAEPNIDSAVEHIAVAQGMDALLVAPATANVIAKFAQGISDDFLTTLYLATTAPVIVAPAMNVNMWQHPATQVNIAALKERGNLVVEPESGYLACGMVGAGRLADNEVIVKAVMEALGPQDFAGETVLITAGPTREPLDPVRYVTNRSSGKMGYAIAEAALRRGAKVILVTGPVSIQPPAKAEVVPVETAEEMRKAVLARALEATVVIKAAAVSDYTPDHKLQMKMKRGGPFALQMVPTKDIAAELAKLNVPNQIRVGFAAETEMLEENARRKLERKHLHAIVGNDVSRADIGFDSDHNEVVILTADSKLRIPRNRKSYIASRILDVIHTIRENVSKTAAATN